MFTAWLNLQPPQTAERRDTLIVHSGRTYEGEVVAKISKDNAEVASVPVRSFDEHSVFAFKLGGLKPPFTVSILRGGVSIDSGTITQIAEAH